MKKLLLILSILLLVPAMAEIGYVDYSVFAANYTPAVNLKKQMDAKLQQIKAYAIQSQKLIDSKKTNEEKRNIGNQRVAEVRKMQKEYNDLRVKRIELVRQKVNEGSKIVLKNKKYDVIISKGNIIAGGKDITQEVLKAVK